MTYKVTLNQHLETLDQNSTVSDIEIKSLQRRVAKKFKDCGYEAASKDKELISEYITMIFKTQDYRCTHWIKVKEGQLNGVWNRPMPAMLTGKPKRSSMRLTTFTQETLVVWIISKTFSFCQPMLTSLLNAL